MKTKQKNIPNIDSLEQRLLCAATPFLHLGINFQPASASIPGGFFADTGKVFAARGNGLEYGWNTDDSAWTRDRNSSKSPNQAYDTFIHTQQGSNRTWNIALPNGTYTVRIVGGDPSFPGAPIKYSVEGQVVLNSSTTTSKLFVEATKIITVNDGRLTLTNSTGATNNKICFIQINSTTGVTGHPVTIPGRLEAEDFIDYKDTTPTNEGGAYRQTPVDLQMTSDTGGGYNVGYIHASEWLEYDINVPITGQYKLATRWATATSGGKFHIEIDGVNVTGAINVTNTGSWNTYKTITSKTVSLTAGVKKLRVVFDSETKVGQSIGKFNYIDVLNTATSTKLPWPTTWKQVANNPLSRFESYGFTYNNKVYVFGGWRDSVFDSTTEMDVYDPSTNKWTSLGNMKAPETHAGIALDDANGVVYFVDGHRGKYPSTPTNEVWKYIISSNTWTKLPNLPTTGGAGVAAVIDGQLHYMGGNLPDRVTNDPRHFSLDLSNPSAGWQQLSNMPIGRDHMSHLVIDGVLYVMGGEIGHDIQHNQQSAVHRYNATNDTWTRLADMPVPRSHAESSSFEWNGKIILAGGQTNPQAPLSRVDQYDPITNTWTYLGELPGKRQGTTVQKVGNQIIVTVGGIQTNQPQITTWIGTIPG